jgi:predicted dehydrogenase
MSLELYNAPVSTHRFDTLLKLDELDVIDICTPSYLHYDQILAALARENLILTPKSA